VLQQYFHFFVDGPIFPDLLHFYNTMSITVAGQRPCISGLFKN